MSDKAKSRNRVLQEEILNSTDKKEKVGPRKSSAKIKRGMSAKSATPASKKEIKEKEEKK